MLRIGHSLVTGFAFAALCATTAGDASASTVEDSTRFTLGSENTLVERSHALTSLALRIMANDPAGALSNARNALLVAEQSGDLRAEHAAMRAKCAAQSRLGMHAEFLQTTITALQLAQAIGDPAHIAVDLQSLATAYRINLQPDKAVEEARNALAMVLPIRNDQGIDQAYRFLMHTLLQARRYDEALRIGEKALERFSQRHDAPDEARIWHLIAQVMLAQQKPGDALPFLTKAERVLEVQGLAEERFVLSMDRVKVLIGLGRYRDADALLDQAEGRVPNAGARTHRNLLVQLRYKLALAGHEWQEALLLLQTLKQWTDSVHDAQVGLKMAGLQVMYQVERKEQDNNELRDVNSRNEATIAEQRTSNRYLIALLGVLLVLAIALFITSRYSLRMMRRSKRKNEVIRKQHDQIHAKNMELQRQNMRLAETLMSDEEKEIMIREIHHRVKNNLQVVDSLLSIQCGNGDEPKVERMLREAQGRIRSMAMVHEHIYRSAGMAHGSLKAHMEQLARNVLVAHGQHDKISVMVETADIVLPVETLMPLSLVVNELLTNAIKYAFTDRVSGHVRIMLRPAGSGHELLFSDDGRGLDNANPFLRERSFGLELVQVLAQQLNGQVRVLKGAGATFSMTFFPDRAGLRKAS